jgi:hypothetical protein
LARGIVKYRLRTSLLLLAGLLVINLFSYVNYYSMEYDREDWKSISSALEEESGNAVIVLYPEIQIHNLRYNYEGDLPIVGAITGKDYTTYDNFDQIEFYKSLKRIDENTACNFLDIIEEYDKVIVIENLLGFGGPEAHLFEECFSSYELIVEQHNTYKDLWNIETKDIRVAVYEKH